MDFAIHNGSLVPYIPFIAGFSSCYTENLWNNLEKEKNDAKRLNINVITVSDDGKPRKLKCKEMQNIARERFTNYYPMGSEI